MMSREFCSGEEEPSELEFICIKARRLIAEEMQPPKAKANFEEREFQFDIDCEDGGCHTFSTKLASEDFGAEALHLGFGSGNGRSSLYKLEECIKEEEDNEADEDEELVSIAAQAERQSISNLSMPLKYTDLGENNPKFPKFFRPKPDHGYLYSSSFGHRSATEQIPASVSFVKLADMSEEEWGLFLEKFQELLYPALAMRKRVTVGQKQKQRLGTSCQF